MSSLPPVRCWVCAGALLWHAYYREKQLKQESPLAAPRAASQHITRAVHWDVAQDVPWQLRALCKGWSEQEFWVAKQS